MSDEQKRILARVRKMMNLAECAGATEGERDNALRMAHATLAKYNLDMAQVEVGGTSQAAGAASDPRKQLAEVFLGTVWARQIALATATLFFCSYFYQKVPRNIHKAKHTFVGRHSNVVTAQEMSKYLIQSVHREAQWYANNHGGDYSLYRSFANGAMAKIAARCRALRRDSEKQTAEAPAVPGMALVVLANVYQNEEAANNQFLAAQGTVVKIKKTISRGEHRSEAMQAGAAYGASVSLNRQVK